MAFQRIRIKRSNVAGKVPGADKLDTAELCINLKDHKLYSKDADGNVFEIAGGGAQVPGGPTPPTSGNEIGDLFFDTVNNTLLYWDGTQWVPIAGDEALALDDLTDVVISNPASDELLVYNGSEWVNADPGYLTEAEVINILEGNKPDGTDNPDREEYAKLSDIGDGAINIDGGLGIEATGDNATANQKTETTRTLAVKTGDGISIDANGNVIIDPNFNLDGNVNLPEVGDGKITIVDADGEPVGEFTVNQADNTEISLPAIPVPEDQIHIGDTYPGTPSLGDLWVDTSECPPVLFIWNDCDGTEGWKPIGGIDTDAINFSALITDDGTPEANTPDHVLTAVAQNIIGGTNPVEYEYLWKVDGLTMGQAKTLNIIQTFVGKIVTCDITVAEPDGSDPVTKTAVYSKVIEVAGTINTPTVLAPLNGDDYSQVNTRNLISDKIIEIEGGGISICETELIESIDDTTDAPNVILTFPSDQDFGCFAQGDVAQGTAGGADEVKVISKTDEAPWQIVVDGGNWSDGTDIVGDIIPTTDKGFFYTDPDIDENYGDPQPIFDAGLNTTFVIILRPSAWLEVEFLTPKTVTSKLYIFGGNYRAGDANFRIYINGDEFRNPDDVSGRWDTPASFGDAIEIPFTGQVTSIRLEADWPETSARNGIGLKEIYIDSLDLANKVTGTVTTEEPGQRLLTKETPYDTKLTVSGGKDLEDMVAGDPMVMSDGTPAGGAYDIKPYKLVTTDIESVNDTDPDNVVLTFPGDVSTNPDLQYFKAGDVVQSGKEWNQDEVWSTETNYVSSNGGFDPVYPATHAFNANLSQFTGTANEVGSTLTWISPVKMTGTVEVYSNWNTGYGQKWSLNGAAEITANLDVAEWRTLGSVDDETVIIASTGLGASRGMLFAIKVDGKMLVDTGIPGDPGEDVKVISTGYEQGQNTMTVDGGSWAQGDTVEYQTEGGKGKLVATNTDDNTIMLSDDPTATRNNRWIKGSIDIDGNAGNSGETGDAAGAKDFYVAGGMVSDEPTLTADIRLQCSEFATTPENADTLSNIIWEINGVEESAGTVNPYKPSNLQTNTTYTVRAKHQGNTLNDSAFSTSSVTFTTGATRNIREYYQEKIDVLQSRLASIEADEVNDDAADTLLITTVANLIERIEALEGGA